MTDEASTAILPVILCGGAGTRLWPASRESMPKQFARLVDPDRSTFQATAKRIANAAALARPAVVASADSRFIVAEQLAQAGVAADILLEPARRDSAAAVAVAALHAARRDPRTVVLTLAADHVVGDDAAFVEAVGRAAAAAVGGRIVTLGVRPTAPSTAYGYVFPGAALPDGDGAYEVERFVEKPDEEGAHRLIGKGALWNAGYFLFRADVMLAEFEAYAPEVLAAAKAAYAGAARDLDFVRLDADAFARAPRISVDYAVMERTRLAAVLPVDFAWSDVGTWDAVWEALPRDADGNALRGRVEAYDTRGSLVHGDGERLTAVVGLDDVVVVTTPDAVLVTSRARAGSVKDLHAALKAGGHPEADEHLRIYRPWGWYQRIDIGQRFQVKRIMVVPGGRLSLQKHFHRAEHWVVVRGTAEVTRDGDTLVVHENEAVQLPIGCVHRLANPGKIPLELIEVQVGSYTGEDDIVRIEDVYGR